MSEILHNKNTISKQLKELEILNYENLPYFTAMHKLLEAFENYVEKTKKNEADLQAVVKGT